MTSGLFVLMVVIVGSAAAGREISEELERIRLGRRPPDDEIRQEWNAVIIEARLRSKAFRDRAHRLRHRHHSEPSTGTADQSNDRGDSRRASSEQTEIPRATRTTPTSPTIPAAAAAVLSFIQREERSTRAVVVTGSMT